MTLKPDPISYPPRGLSRDEAARWIGVSPTKFDTMVAEGRMPKPREDGGRLIWDRYQLDAAFSDLPAKESNYLRDGLAAGKKFAGLIK